MNFLFSKGVKQWVHGMADYHKARTIKAKREAEKKIDSAYEMIKSEKMTAVEGITFSTIDAGLKIMEKCERVPMQLFNLAGSRIPGKRKSPQRARA